MMDNGGLKINTTLKSIWGEFIYGGHLLSLSDASIVFAIMILFDKPVSLPLLVIAYLIPQVIYSLDHIKEFQGDKETNPERVEHLEKNIVTYRFMAVIYLVLMFSLLVIYSNVNTMVLVIAVGVGGILYPKNLTKKIIGFKNYYVGLLSAFGLCFLPFFHYGLNFDSLFLAVVLFALSRLFLNTVFFDLKDYEADKKNGLKTIVVALGLNKTIIFLSAVNLLSAVIIIKSVYFSIIPSYALGLLFVVIYSFVYLFLAKKLSAPQLRAISYLMVDGEYLFWPILILIFKEIM